MHLKNFALLTNEENEIILSPVYDLVSTKIAMPEDKEEVVPELEVNQKNEKP